VRFELLTVALLKNQFLFDLLGSTGKGSSREATSSSRRVGLSM
jgi:hypothetical protein